MQIDFEGSSLVEFKKNKKLRFDAISFFKEGLESINPINLVNSHLVIKGNVLTCSDINGALKKYNLESFDRIFVVGAGKASANMAKAVEEILADRIFSGVVVTKYGFTANLNKIKLIEAGHPIPDENGVKGTYH